MAKTKDLGFQDKWIGKKAHVFLDPDRANISIVYWPKGWPGGNERYTRDYSHPALAKTAYRKMTTLDRVDRFRALAKRSNPQRKKSSPGLRAAGYGLPAQTAAVKTLKSKLLGTIKVRLWGRKVFVRSPKAIRFNLESYFGAAHNADKTYQNKASALRAFNRLNSVARASNFLHRNAQWV